MNLNFIIEILEKNFHGKIKNKINNVGELEIIVDSKILIEVLEFLKQHESCSFEQLMDLSVVDYLHYNLDQWSTIDSNNEGFSRGKKEITISNIDENKKEKRFCVVYNLLSISNNLRIRVKSFAKGYPPKIASVVNIWNSANWYEREAFDMFGVVFDGHPNLTRILMDDDFEGYPLRKDFPLSGYEEVYYDENQEEVLKRKAQIEPKVLVPKVIRENGN